MDPTLLLPAEYWASISSPVDNLPEKYLLVYALDAHARLEKEVMEIARAMDLPVVVLDVRDNPEWRGAAMTVRTAGPREFLTLFSKAEFIVTNSFHGNVFSLLFNKQFYSIPHRYSNGRMSDLLGRLESLAAQDLEHVLGNPSKSIDYDKVNPILDGMREESYGYLRRAVELAGSFSAPQQTV